MDNNSYTNVLDSGKSTGQPVYKCGLCHKEFLYYRDLAVHERMHLERLTLDTVRSGYENRHPVLYNTPTVPITTLDSFDKLVQPFRGELDMRVGQTDGRSSVPTSSAPEMDKGPPVYRTESDTRGSVSLASRMSPADGLGMNMDMRSLPIDNRALPLDSRALTMDSRNMQSLDSRPLITDTRSIPVDTRTYPYSSASFLESINPSMYSTDHHNKIPTSTATSFQIQSGLRPEDYLPVDSRNQALPKLDSQVFSKPDPYYGISKAHYSSMGSIEKPHPNYAPSQYGLTKLLGQPPSPYYPQPVTSQDQPKYDMDKLPSPSSLNYYNQAGISQADPKLEKRQPSPSPKQTLYYGQPPVSTHPVTMATNSQYQFNLPKPTHLQFQNTRELLNKPIAEKPEMGKMYPSGHTSPHLTYTDAYKGSQPQPQIFTPVPSQSAPAQHGYGYYKPGTVTVPATSIASKLPGVALSALRECECYICFAPFPNMNELSEHMKIHARENIASEVGHQYPQYPATTARSVGVSNSYMSTMAAAGEPVTSVNNVHIRTSQPPPPHPSAFSTAPFRPETGGRVSCQICGKTFLKPTQLAEHVKIHFSDQKRQFECKTCKKVFDKQSKCLRHEALHQRNIKLFYCEICEKDFTFKGNYLYHVQVEHSKEPVEAQAENKAVLVNSEADKIVDCQICDEEVVKNKLVDHLKNHPVHTCDKCERVFIQKTEYVEHLMNDHWRELQDSSDAKSGSENSDNERTGANKTERARVESEEKDSGLEEDHEKDREDMEAKVTTANIESIQKKITASVKKNVKSKADDTVTKADKKVKAAKIKVKKELSSVESMKKEPADSKDKKDMYAGKEKTEDIKLENEEEFEKETKFKFSCSKCEETFERKSDLDEHVDIHVRDPSRLYCEVCCNTSYNVREKGYYIYHMKRHTDADLDLDKLPEKLTCHVCLKEIKREIYISHIIDQHTKYNCDMCQWSYSSETSLFNHMKKIHSNSKVKYILKKGGGIEIQHKNLPVVYKKLKDVAQGEEEGDPGSPQSSFMCKVCSRVFTKKSSVENHMKKHNVKPIEQHVNCEICNLQFTSKGAYFYHILQAHEHYEAPVPQTDTESHENEMKVEKDDKGSNADNEQDSTGKSVETVLNPETGDFEEKVVEDEKNDKETVENEKGTSSNKVAKDVVSEIFYCKLCNMCLKRDSLYEHTKEHTLFNCNLCQFSFTKKAQYLHHKKMIHLDEMVAAEIDRAETEEQLLIKASESGKRKRTDLIKLCTCPVCSGEFRQDRYIEHIKTHKKMVMQCRFCGRDFSKKNLLAIHEKSHERITHEHELPFARNCPVCNAGIVSRLNYVQHLGEHFKHGPFTCKTCSKEFIADKILENHIRVYHDDNLKVFWTLDGKGMKFDMRTGRYGEIATDYLEEIRELNEIMKANRKPEIWLTVTPKKAKDKGGMNKSQGKKVIEEDEAVKTEDDKEPAKGNTSDDEYVPDKKRKNTSSDGEEEDDDYNPTSAKKKKKQLTFSADDDSTSEEEYSNKVSTTKRAAVTVSKTSMQRLRQLRERTKMKASQKKKSVLPRRALRSAFPSDKIAQDISENETNSNDSDSNRKRLKRKVTDAPDDPNAPKKTFNQRVKFTPEELEEYRLKPGQPFPKNCPVCDLHIYGRTNYIEHFMSHTGEKPHKCPYCDLRFTREWNMNTHAMKVHNMKSPIRSYTPKPKEATSPSTTPVRDSKTYTDKKLRTRTSNITEEEPLSSSTPIRMTKVSVKISPLQLDEKQKLDLSQDSDKKSTPVADRTGSGRPDLFVCEFCNKKMKSNWNYSQHIEWHKKQLKKKENESKPFSCKNCAESFKKKRDLYIHTKVHSGYEQDDDESMMDVSRTESETNDTANVSFSSSVQDSDMSAHAESNCKDTSGTMNTSGRDTDSRRMSASSTSNVVNGNAIRDKSNVNSQCDDSSTDSKDNNNKPNSSITAGLKDKVSGATNSETAAVDTSTSSKTPETNSKLSEAAQCKGNNCETVTSNINTDDLSNEKTACSKDQSLKKGSPFRVESDEAEHSNNGVKNVVTHRNSNSDHRRQSDSEAEDKNKSTKTPPPVKKMSSELALSKWKTKVRATLSSQLELNEAKKQEEIANPEMARVKEKLAITNKMEKKKNFECRICGDAFDFESAFRDHMDVHLNESPPYCSICDMYFMAIYPKRRLLEHNKKKHPELQS